MITRSRFVAAASVTALTAGLALVAPGTAAAAGAGSGTASTVDGKKGNVGWGVKASFREYVEGPIAQGGIIVTPPAQRLADGTFRFGTGKGSVDVDADTATIRAKGKVYFFGHDDGTGPQLQLWISNPRVIIDGADSVLVADVKSRLFEGDVVTYDDVDVVTLDAADLDLVANKHRVVKVTGVATTLTEAGVEAFGGFYGAGTPFDDLSFKIKLAKK
jgi:hypothetical protein